MGHSDLDPAVHDRRPWNAGKNVGPKGPLKPRDIWAIRFYLDEHKRLRGRPLFDLAIDSKWRPFLTGFGQAAGRYGDPQIRSKSHWRALSLRFLNWFS